MKTWHITLSIIMLFIFGIVFYAIQKGQFNPEIEALKMINPLTPTPMLYDPNKVQQEGIVLPAQTQSGQAQAPQQNQPQSQQQYPQTQPQQQQPAQQQYPQSQSPQQQSANQTQTSNSQTASPQEKPVTKASIVTSKGTILIELYPAEAPGTVANFSTKSKSNYYNNLVFHRVENWVIQGGDPLGTGAGGGKMPTEISGRPFVIGSVGIARGGDIQVSNDSQFFITKSDSPHLNNLYTNFGTVLEGMDVVNKIAIGDKIQEIKLE